MLIKDKKIWSGIMDFRKKILIIRKFDFRNFDIRNIVSNFKQFIGLIIFSIQKNKCGVRAAALTYVTTLSIVPFLAIAFSISKGLGFHHTEFIHNFLLKITAGREDVVTNILSYINNTNAGKLGGLGVVTLLGVVVSLIGTIEDTLNAIFEIPKNRSLKEKITSYFSITLLFPILMIVIATFSSSLINIPFIKKLLSYSLISYVYLFLMKIVPFLMIWFSIFIIFYYIPNGKIDTWSILVGSFFSSLLWEISRYIFINYHPFNPKYNAIYGSFAKILLVLLWLYFSWFMLLIGAVIAYELKSIKYGGFNVREKLGTFNIALKEFVFLKIICYMIDLFKKGDGVVTLEELSNVTKLPIFIVLDFIEALKNLGFIVSLENEKRSFVIAADFDNCTLGEFLKIIRSYDDVDLKKIKGVDGYRSLNHLYSLDKNIPLAQVVID